MSEKLTNEQIKRIINIAFYMSPPHLYILKRDKHIKLMAEDELLNLCKDKDKIEEKDIAKVKKVACCFVDNYKNFLKQTGIDVDSIDFNSKSRLIDLVGSDKFKNIRQQLISLTSDFLDAQTQTQQSVSSADLANNQTQTQQSVSSADLANNQTQTQQSVSSADLTNNQTQNQFLTQAKTLDEFWENLGEIVDEEVFNEILKNLYDKYDGDVVNQMDVGALVSAIQDTSSTIFQNLNLGVNTSYNQNYSQNNTNQNSQVQQVSSINQNQPQNSVNNTNPAQNQSSPNPYSQLFNWGFNWGFNAEINYFLNQNRPQNPVNSHNTNQNSQAPTIHQNLADERQFIENLADLLMNFYNSNDSNKFPFTSEEINNIISYLFDIANDRIAIRTVYNLPSVRNFIAEQTSDNFNVLARSLNDMMLNRNESVPSLASNYQLFK